MADDPVIRQRLAWCYSKVQIMRFNGMRTLTQFLAGHHPGPDGAISKLYWSEYHKVVTELAVDILGADALVPTGRPPSSAFQTDDRRRAELVGVVGRHVPQRPGRHDLRRVVADPAQHHRRDGPRPAEGAPTGVTGVGRRTSPPCAAPARRCGRPALRQLRRMTAAGVGGGDAPFLPVPSKEYLRFRLLTQYGDAAHAPSPPMW